MTRVLVAFDKFKDALTAQQAGEIAAGVLRAAQAGWSIDLAPISDGGEGFSSILTQAVDGRESFRSVAGPRGERVAARFGLIPLAAIPSPAQIKLQLSAGLSPGATVAVIEMAAASGLALLAPAQRDPWRATTFGTGELMRAAAEAGAMAIILGVGGSATNDLGLGALAALGMKFTDAAGAAVEPPAPAQWERIVAIAGGMPAGFPPVHIACDVTNPLLGPRGAAATFGPQKGLKPDGLARLESETARLADLLSAHAGCPASSKFAPGTGAAGGIAFGLMTAADAKLVPGFDLVSAWLDLDAKLAAADIVITGEGRFDASSLGGKGPGAIAGRALAAGKPVHLFAGQINAPHVPGLNLHAITPPGVSLAEALRDSADNLAKAVRRVFGQ